MPEHGRAGKGEIMGKRAFQTTNVERRHVRGSVRIMHRQCVGLCKGREILGRKAYAVVIYDGTHAVRVVAASDDLMYVSGVADGIYYESDMTLIGLESCCPKISILFGARRR